MKEAYRIRLARPRRRAACFLLLLGALCLYLATLPGKNGGMKVETAAGVLVSRDETLPGYAFYIVSLHASADPLTAQAESACYAPRGASGGVLHADGIWHAVGAVFGDADSAAASAQSLSSAEGIAAQAVTIDAPETSMRITASQRQITALKQADGALPAAIDALGKTAAQIDAGEIDLQGARGQLYAQSARLESIAAELEAAAPQEKLCRELAGRLKDAAAEALRLSQLENAPRLQFSSSVRCLQARMICEFCAYRQSIAK